MINDDWISIHVGPQASNICRRDLMAFMLLGPSQQVFDLWHPAYEIAPDELAPAMSIFLAVPLILFLLSEFRLKHFGIVAEP